MADDTQIHTHIWYAEFNDILPEIASMDADVITIETSRSDMELLRGLGDFQYPNEIGPGVYDIHSPCVPTQDEIVRLLRKARIPRRTVGIAKAVLRIEHPAGHGGIFLQLVLHNAGIECRFIAGDDDKRRAGGRNVAVKADPRSIMAYRGVAESAPRGQPG